MCLKTLRRTDRDTKNDDVLYGIGSMTRHCPARTSTGRRIAHGGVATLDCAADHLGAGLNTLVIPPKRHRSSTSQDDKHPNAD